MSSSLAKAVEDRHPSTKSIAAWFEFRHLPPNLQPFSRSFYDLALRMIQELPDSPELTAGLRKLLEAKDCMVRAATLVEEDPKNIPYYVDR